MNEGGKEGRKEGINSFNFFPSYNYIPKFSRIQSNSSLSVPRTSTNVTYLIIVEGMFSFQYLVHAKMWLKLWCTELFRNKCNELIASCVYVNKITMLNHLQHCFRENTHAHARARDRADVHKRTLVISWVYLPTA